MVNRVARSSFEKRAVCCCVLWCAVVGGDGIRRNSRGTQLFGLASSDCRTVCPSVLSLSLSLSLSLLVRAIRWAEAVRALGSALSLSHAHSASLAWLSLLLAGAAARCPFPGHAAPANLPKISKSRHSPQAVKAFPCSSPCPAPNQASLFFPLSAARARCYCTALEHSESNANK